MVSTSDLYREDKHLKARVEDACRLCERRGIARFVGFLDAREAMLAKGYIRQLQATCDAVFYGGHNDAERVMLGLFPEASDVDRASFPLATLAFYYRKEADITHRDVLGSVIGCGVVREKIGDILCEEGRAIAFLHEDIAAFVAESLDKIGREGVKIEWPFMGEIHCVHHYRSVSGTVASPRLDAVLKVLLGISREQAAQLIQSAVVSVNHVPTMSVSRTLIGGEVLSVKGYGRYIVDDVSAVSKKGRVILSARQYV